MIATTVVVNGTRARKLTQAGRGSRNRVGGRGFRPGRSRVHHARTLRTGSLLGHPLVELARARSG